MEIEPNACNCDDYSDNNVYDGADDNGNIDDVDESCAHMYNAADGLKSWQAALLGKLDKPFIATTVESSQQYFDRDIPLKCYTRRSLIFPLLVCKFD